ncbi:MAG: HD-GYP domain-containing protein [Paenibacillaceae bacterium]
MQMKALIGQEKRAANLFVILLLSVIFVSDVLFVTFVPNEVGFWLLTPYIFLYLLIPIVFIMNKRQSPRYIKYIFFFIFIVVCLINEIVLFWESPNYQGGSVVEMFFILFSPIFINKRYYWTVTLGVISKYVIVGLLLQTMTAIWAMLTMLVLALVAFIILNRFIGYIEAMNNSYLKQFEGVVKGIVSTLELKDPYTRGHSERVAEYAVILAESLSFYGQDDLKLISYACLLHDVGKVHTPDSILTKPTLLTDEEYTIVKKHPIVGANAIKDIEGMELCLDIILYHHERWDGKGYPEGLKEMQIPLTARITAIADSFDAMTSHRSYRGAMSGEQAYEQIVNGRGKQFDPALVDHFLNIFPLWTSILEKKREYTEEVIQKVAESS